MADEPTTALDVTIQQEIMDLLARLRRERGMSIILITHNFGIVANFADHVQVMRKGRIVEHGPTAQVMGDPSTSTRRASSPASRGSGNAATASLPSRTGSRSRELPRPTPPRGPRPLRALPRSHDLALPQGCPEKAVDQISFTVPRGKTVGVVGESGSGKSTTGKAIIKLAPLTSGLILYKGQDIGGLPNHAFKLWRKKIQMIFQDPYNSLNPRADILGILSEPLEIHFPELSEADRKDRCAELLAGVQLSPTSSPATLTSSPAANASVSASRAPSPSNPS